MKQLFLIASFVLLFASCKKEENEPTPSPVEPTPTLVSGKIKSIRTDYINQGMVSSSSTGEIEYNNLGQPINIITIDSALNGQTWVTATYNQSISYNAFNKMAYQSMNTNGFFYSTEYLYNSSQKLITEITTSTGNQKDTMNYSYNGNLVVGEIKQGSYTSRAFYSLNLDSIKTFNINNELINKTILKRNSTIDMTNNYSNQFLGIISDKHELTDEITSTYNSSGVEITTAKITRAYYPNGYTKEVTYFRNGTALYYRNYTYY